ncbi:hypothetical protein [Halorussus amylolyticus]|uniref:hypothetical protein n=1 Tax=Halorussus amylolyticus TaxID=1126242 RepID=UPI001EE479D0|nr:hypothetical protein [Halorussus amylolyticus]
MTEAQDPLEEGAYPDESVAERIDGADIVGGLQTVLEEAESATSGARSVAPDPEDMAEDLRDRIHAALEKAGVDAPTRPATAKLTHDQADLLVDLLAGFSSRREILEWEQELVIQTVGQLEDSWYTRTAADAPTVAALLGEPWGPCKRMPPELAVEIRRGIVAKDLLPAFHAGHEVARWAAVERVDHLDDNAEGDDIEPIDPQAQQYPLMRPAFGEVAGQQAAALEQLLEGFENAEALLAWSLQVVSASYAQIERETVTRPYFEKPLRQHLVGGKVGDKDRFVRESWAAEFLLPAFNRAADALGHRATEVTAGETYRGETGGGSIS